MCDFARLIISHSLQMSEGDSSLLCPVCKSDVYEISFSCRPLLHRHIQTEHGYVQCSKCPVTVFVAPDSLHQHNTKNHPDLGPLKRKHEEEEEIRSSKRLAKSADNNRNIDLSSLTDGEYSAPTKYSKDPLKGFFLQTVLECAECEERPTRKFSSYNAWLVHLKSSHKGFSSLADYKAAHGDPSVVKFKHSCRVCGLEMFLNLTIIKRHLSVQHQMNVTQYLAQFREELLEEKRSRPLLASQHTLEGWWEGCMYSCRLCQYNAQSQTAFESHLSQAHQISGQVEIQEKYVKVWGKLATLTRYHQCFICSQVIRHEYRIIFQHLSRHQTDLHSYTKLYRDQLVEELEKKNMGYVVEREKQISTAVSIEEYLEKHKNVSDVKEDNLMDNWYDCSQHLCKICDKSFWSNLRFHWHIKREHGIKSTKDYRRQHGDPEVKLRQHKCLVCNSLIKWEASRIRDHLKAHKNAGDKMSLKQYGERFRETILAEIKIIKGQAESQETASTVIGSSQVVKEGHALKGEAPHDGYSVEEWKELFGKKINPDDKVECSLCQKVMNRHSYNRHQDRHHKGILNMRDLTRLKRKQLQLARTGVIKSLSELMKLAGGVTVCRGKGENREEVNIEEEEQESRLNMYKAGLSLDQIEKKMILINSGLTITKADSDTEKEGDKENNLKEVSDTDETVKNYSTYVVNQETGEIILLEESQAETIIGCSEDLQDDDSDLYDSETETGPLDGRVMEIDATSDQLSVEVEEDVKIIMLDEQYPEPEPEEAEEVVLSEAVTEDEQVKPSENIVLLNEMENVQFVVADEEPAEVREVGENKELLTGYLLVCEEGQVVVEQEPGAWTQLGHDSEYEPKAISRPRVEPGGGVSQGTVVCQWTKLAGDRQRVATNKLITPSLHAVTPRLDRQGQVKEPVRAADISSLLLYSSGGKVWRDVGCQVTPHRVNGVPTSREEEHQQAETIRQFLRGGGTLDRTCPGCGKMMSRQRNLVSHIQLIHGVEVEGSEREEHIARHTRENVRVQCQLCSRIVSRKSIKRHINLCHPSTNQ